MQPLEPHEAEIHEPSELLRRQINPNHLKPDQTLCSLVFRPSRGKPAKISTFRHSLVTAEEAREKHEEAGNRTIGHCSVSVEQVQQAGLRTVDDSAIPDVPYGHAYIDMQHLDTKGDQKRAADKLVIAARDTEVRYDD